MVRSKLVVVYAYRSNAVLSLYVGYVAVPLCLIIVCSA